MLPEEVLKIAIIEDSEDDREVYRRYLEKQSRFSFKFYEASEAEAGLQLVKKSKPDCLLLDYNLPDATGVEFIDKLKKSGIVTAVVVLTGEGSEKIAVSTMKGGANDYLIKGEITPRSLQKAVIDSIEKSKLVLELDIANEKLSSLVKARAEFLANMSHEIRTPLNAIIGFAELILDDFYELEDGLRADMNKINKAGHHLKTLIDNILDISKVEAGKMQLNNKGVEIASILSTIKSIVPPLMEDRKNRFTIKGVSSGGLYLDDLKLNQILLNILGNAAKFTSDGEVTLTITETTRKKIPGILFQVKDNGIGMSSDELKRVFEAFGQASSQTATAYGGRGLGLYLSYVYCELMGGSLKAESKKGYGSTFLVWLPKDNRDLTQSISAA